jgi:hypothetical protein
VASGHRRAGGACPQGLPGRLRLLAHLLGADNERIASDDQVTGKVLENFVVMEVVKHAEWATASATAYHYRQRDEEIDLILESRSGDVAAIEVKAAATVNRNDLKAIEKLRDACGKRFKAGVVVCTTGQTTPLGDRIWALPLASHGLERTRLHASRLERSRRELPVRRIASTQLASAASARRRNLGEERVSERRRCDTWFACRSGSRGVAADLRRLRDGLVLRCMAALGCRWRDHLGPAQSSRDHEHLPAEHRQQRDRQHRPRTAITDDLGHRGPI